MEEISTVFGDVPTALPKRTTLTIMGPKIDPKLLTPPARFNLSAPVSGVPKATAKGLAAVCCSENPIAIKKKEAKIKLKDPEFTAGIMVSAPIAEITSP